MSHRRTLEVDLGAVLHNVRVIKKITGKKLLACVKCDGYGLGAIPVSKKIEDDVDWFGVATVEEAISLRKVGIKRPILVLGPVHDSDVRKAIDHKISLTAAGLDFIKDIISAESLSIHLKIDTGMGRIGIFPEQLPEALRLLRNSKIRVEGVFSHLSDSENPDKSFARKQIEIFKKAISSIPAKYRAITHIANSGGIVNVPESVKSFSMVRTGLLLYGVYPSLFLRTFKSIPSLHYAVKGKAEVLSLREVPAGTSISYGATYVCKEKTTIAIAGIGYGDGLNRALSNRFFMKIDNKLFPIRGRICMDQTILEVDSSVKKGEEIVFLDFQLSVENMAELCRTVPHEIMTGFGVSRIKKVYHG